MNGNILTFAKKYAERITGNVLEVGSFNVNGSVREVLPITIGVDFREGKDVDMVVDVVKLASTFGENAFDCVVSCDALEHMEHFHESLANMWAVLKPGGVLLLTMANPKKGLHGYPHDYHRLPLDRFLSIFRGNTVLGSFEGGPSMGAAIVKTGDLDLTIQPDKVETWHSQRTRNSKRR